MLQKSMHLLDSEFHCEELVQETKCCGRTSAISSHPWFHMINLVVDLIYNFMVSLQSVKFFEII